MPAPSRRLRSSPLSVEPLETRDLPAVLVPPPSFAEVEANDTLDAATPIGDVTLTASFTLDGQVGHAADIDWYNFTLTQAARLSLNVDNSAVLTLYRQSPFDAGDPYTILGERLLEQGTTIDRDLAAGTYSLAISGQGNFHFHPFLAGSGYAGQTGAYQVTASVAPLTLGPTDGPVVLVSDTAGPLERTPLLLRVGFDKAIDWSSVILDYNVVLRHQPSGGAWTNVSLIDSNLNSNGDELRLVPSAPLAAGRYELLLGGDSTTYFLPLMAMDGTFLGADAAHPDGRDFTLSFEVTASDSTLAAPQELGDLSGGGLWHHLGTVGDDPGDPFGAADIDYYRFSLSGAGLYLVGAEALAGRIGSLLDPTLRLYQSDALGNLTLIAANDDTLNPIVASDHRSYPVQSDAVLFTGLQAGDYVITVASQPDGGGNQQLGDYTLSLLIERDDTPPWVMNVTPGDGTTLSAPPTRLLVTFSEPLPLAQIAAQTTGLPRHDQLHGVYVEGAGGRSYPRLESFDAATNTATFLMLEGLAPGSYTLHLSGSLGLTDLAGNALLDQAVTFTVAGPARQWDYLEPLGAAHEQSLGVLFPLELEAGIVVTRGPENGRTSINDNYVLEVLQSGLYTFTLSGQAVQDGATLELRDADGNLLLSRHDSGVPDLPLNALLSAGTYRLVVIGDGVANPSGDTYELRMSMDASSDSPPPLTTGPTPALRLQLSHSTPPPAPPIQQIILPSAAPNFVAIEGASLAGPVLAGRLSAPSGSLLSLGSGPSGEAGGRGLQTDRLVFGGGVDPALVELLVGLLVFTEGDEVQTSAEPGTERVPAPSPAAEAVAPLAVDSVFQGVQAWQAPAAASPVPQPATPIEAPPLVAVAPAAEPIQAAAPVAPPWRWALAPLVLLLGAAALVPVWRRRWRTGRRGVRR